MDDFQNRFNSAAEHVQLIAEQTSKSDLLKLYGLYKQSTCHGDFDSAPKPGFFDFKGKEKYNAWLQVSRLDQNESRLKYIKLVQSISPDYVYDSAVRSSNSMTKTVSRMVPQAENGEQLHYFLAQDRLKYDGGFPPC